MVREATDIELLRKYAHRTDESAFRIILERHGPIVMGVCLRVLWHREDAEEVYQETFMRI
jgi:DNA-directed RNA polymerase specialized sigma24 family protein